MFSKKKLEESFKENADKKKVVFWLDLISFTESSFFPIPPDPFQIILTLAKPDKWLMFARRVFFWSVLGGVFGYLIGFWFFDLFGQRLIDFYSLHEEVEVLRQLFNNNTFVATFIAALTPIPYKVFTLSAGLFHVNFLIFLLASVVGRGIRFFVVGYITKFFGERYAEKIFKYFDIITIVLIAAIVVYLLV